MRYGSGQSRCHSHVTAIRANQSALLALGTWLHRQALTPVVWCAPVTAAVLKRFCYALLLLSPILACTEDLAFSQPSGQVIEGVAVIHQQNEAEARKRALHTCWRTAVEVAVADLADIDVRVTNAHVLQIQIYAKASQYIQSYRVRWEYPDATRQMYRVGLDVDVAMEELAQQLVVLGISTAQRDIPRLLVLLETRQPTQKDGVPTGDMTRTMAQELRHSFQSQSLRLVNGDMAIPWDQRVVSVLRRAKAVQAEMVLVGWVEVETHPEETAGRPYIFQATVDVTLWDATTGGQLAHERTQAMIHGANTTRTAQDAVARATAEIAVRLAPMVQQVQPAYPAYDAGRDDLASQSTNAGT